MDLFDNEESSDEFIEWNVSMPNNQDVNESGRNLNLDANISGRDLDQESIALQLE